MSHSVLPRDELADDPARLDGWVRDENGIHMVTCDYCEGEGRAPAPE